MAQVRCLRCERWNDPDETAGQCLECGDRLPVTELVPPEPAPPPPAPDPPPYPPPSSPAMRKAVGEASTFLLVIALLHGICGCTILTPDVQPGGMVGLNRFIGVLIVGLGAVFLGLAFSARTKPVEAAQIGLSIYCFASVIDCLAVPKMFLEGYGFVARGILIIVWVGMLIRIQRGLRNARLHQNSDDQPEHHS